MHLIDWKRAVSIFRNALPPLSNFILTVAQVVRTALFWVFTKTVVVIR
jgi:hypothetical protein